VVVIIWTEMRTWLGTTLSGMLCRQPRLVQQVKIRATTSQTANPGAEVWRSGIQGNVNVGGNANDIME
jgi:hypothetical protein